MIMVTSSFLKSSVFPMFPSTLKRKASVFKFLRFGKLFSDGVVWTVGLTVEIKLRLSGVVWTMTKAKFRRRTSHEPNRMQMRENKGFCSFAFDSAHVNYGV